MRFPRLLTGIAGAPLVLLAACGGGSDQPRESVRADSKDPEQVLKLAVEPSPGHIRFDKRRLEARAGKIAIELTNPTRLNHNVRIATGSKCCFRPGSRDLGGTNTTGPGTIRGVVNLRPGKYVYYCAVGGHWQLGQHGKLVVR
jgi:plastocyanin